MEKPDTVTVVVTRRDEVEADKVDVHVTITGSSLITGSAALRKAKEVSQLVASLGDIGIKEHDIVLKSVHAESSGGILGKSTSATYQLRIRCNDLEILPDILGAVTAQKNVTLDSLAWRYPHDQKLKNDWLKSCLVEAKEKAEAIASSLGVRLLGVHSMGERWLDSEHGNHEEFSRVMTCVPRKMRAERVDLGFPLSHSKWLEVQVEIQFRVSEF